MRSTPPSTAPRLCDCPHCGTPWRAYAALFHDSPHPMWVFDRETLRFLEVNRAAIRRYGYSRQEFLERSVLDIRPADDVERVASVIRGGGGDYYPWTEWRHVLRDGRVVDVSVTAHAIEWEDRPAWIATAVQLPFPRQTERQQWTSSRRQQSLTGDDARFRLLVEGSEQLLFYVHGLDGHFRYVSPAALPMLGYAPDELLGRPYSDVLSPDERAADVQRLTDRALESGEPQPTYQAFAVHQDGRQVVLEITEEPVTVDGEVVAMQGVARDVTNRVAAEAARRQTEERLHAIVHTLSEGLVIVGASGRVVFANPSAERILGISCAELSRRPYTALGFRVRRENGAPLSWDETALLRVMESGEPVHDVERTLDLADGRSIALSVNLAPMRDDSGAITGVVASLRDVTEKKRRERDLQALHQRLLAIVNTSPLGIVLLDAAGAVQVWNGAAEALFGWSADEVIGRPCPIQYADGAPVRAEQAAVEAAGATLQGDEVQRLSRSGLVLTLSMWSARLGGESGGMTGVLLLFADLSGRKQLEEQLRQAQKMEAVGRLAGGIAHDFNNVLTSILGHADLLLERPDTSVELHDDLEEIRKGAERARSLTQQLLAFSRKQHVQPRVVNATTVVRDMWRMLLHLMSGDIDTTLDVEPGLWPVLIDRGQLEQVLLNLAVNARDAMPDGGTLRVRLRNVHFDGRGCLPQVAAGPYVELEVSDSGAGIDPGVLPYIFEPFFTTKDLGKGTGLGLATVYAIMAQNGGCVAVDSEPGRGSAFRVLLPRTEGTFVEEARTPAAPDASGSETILLVEDEAPIRALARRVLERRGYMVLEASQPADALRIVQEYDGPIHLLLTDVVMPGMHGRDLVQQLTGIRRDLRVVYMSGYTDEILGADESRSDGALFLEKPFTPAALAVTVRAALEPRDDD